VTGGTFQGYYNLKPRRFISIAAHSSWKGGTRRSLSNKLSPRAGREENEKGTKDDTV